MRGITKNLGFIRAFFNEVKTKILQKPAYQSYIEGTQSYATYSKGGGAAAGLVSPEVIAALGPKFPNIMISDMKRTKQVPITVNDLSSVQNFRAWQTKNFPKMPPSNILDQVKEYLDRVPQPQVQPARRA